MPFYAMHAPQIDPIEGARMESVPVDVATLSDLSESSILSCLEERFSKQYFQVHIGENFNNSHDAYKYSCVLLEV